MEKYCMYKPPKCFKGITMENHGIAVENHGKTIGNRWDKYGKGMG